MKIISLGLLLAASLLLSSHMTAASLTPGTAVELTGTTGKFDFIKMDVLDRRLLACHTGNGSLDVIDVDAGKLIKSVATGAAQGVAVDEKGGRYFVSVSKPPKMVIIDSTKLEVIGEVPLSGPADLCAYSPKLNWVFVDNDEKGQIWEIDLKMMTVLHSWELSPETGMEDLAFDSAGTFFVQNVKDASKLFVVDYAANPIFAGTQPMMAPNPTPEISTLPAEKPHGLALVGDDKVLIAGGNGKLVLLDVKAGKVVASTDIAVKVDEIAYDAGLRQAYCASGAGLISTVSVSANKLATIDSVPSAPGAHSIAVDPKTHTVWVAFVKDNKPYVQPFAAK